MKRLTGFFITGAAVGAAIALLYAPKPGAQTRKDIRKFSKRTLNDTKRTLNEGYDQVVEVFDNVKDYVEDSKSKLQKLIRSA
jgi:gas vesicle protein